MLKTQKEFAGISNKTNTFSPQTISIKLIISKREF